ncbi:MAG: Fe-S cluster assembly protein HesB [Candidatus Eremiobacteraeota bacterium]|nr:Fe-S cluster assembly protein HesB [Candidatus Eremiobacteraeota bacterium]
MTLPLVGAGGEPIDLRRTICSHGLIDLLPHRPAGDYRALETTLRFEDDARTVRIAEEPKGCLTIALAGRSSAAMRAAALAAVRTMLALDDDLSGFYARVADDPQLAWAAKGAGRLMRSPTAFEDVIKTILTTNCAWSATIRMNRALVEGLGPQAPDGTHAFPSPHAMAAASPAFYRDEMRAGYRGPYLRALAERAASGELDLEALRDAPRDALDDESLEKQLRALPGVGPYAAAHIMMLFGRRHRLVLDSATRPKYARLNGRKAKDATIVRRFARYGDDAGLAFWLFLTRDWLE